MAIVRSDTETRLWRPIVIVALLGVISWGVNALYPSNSFKLLLGMGIWAGVVIACAIILKALSNADDFLKAIAVMCGLQSSFAQPFIAWRSSLRNPYKQIRIGTLSAGMSSGSIGLLAFLACAPICLRRSVCLWRRGESPSGLVRPLHAAVAGVVRAYDDRPRHGFCLGRGYKAFKAKQSVVIGQKDGLARSVGYAAIVGEILLLGGLSVLAWFPKGVPEGFVPGTVVISLSAVVFLGLISWMRDRTPPIGAAATPEIRAEYDRQQRAEIKFFTVGLFVIAFVVALAVWISPTQVGRFLGSMVVTYFAFGAILAVINASEFAVMWVTEKGWFGATARPRVVGAYAVAFVVGLAVLNAWLHPFHRVRLCDGGDCVAMLTPDGDRRSPPRHEPGTAGEAAYVKAHGDEPVPMFMVATAGGGIRAAYWTATVLTGSRRTSSRGWRAPLSLLRSAVSPAAASAPRLLRRR